MSSAKKSNDGESFAKNVTITNSKGLHARPAASFVRLANRFKCDVFVEKDGEKVNGKSIMGLMMLAAGPGSQITVQAVGHDAPQVVHELEALIKRKFDEE